MSSDPRYLKEIGKEFEPEPEDFSEGIQRIASDAKGYRLLAQSLTNYQKCKYKDKQDEVKPPKPVTRQRQSSHPRMLPFLGKPT